VFVPSTGLLERFIRRRSAPLVLLLLVIGTRISAENPAPGVEVFLRQRCPHCIGAKQFLEDLYLNRSVYLWIPGALQCGLFTGRCSRARTRGHRDETLSASGTRRPLAQADQQDGDGRTERSHDHETQLVDISATPVERKNAPRRTIHNDCSSRCTPSLSFKKKTCLNRKPRVFSADPSECCRPG